MSKKVATLLAAVQKLSAEEFSEFAVEFRKIKPPALAEKRKFRIGTECKVRWDSGEVFHGILVGGGTKAKVWFPDQPATSYYRLDWMALLEINHKSVWPIDAYTKCPTTLTIDTFKKKYAKEYA